MTAFWTESLYERVSRLVKREPGITIKQIACVLWEKEYEIGLFCILPGCDCGEFRLERNGKVYPR